MTGILVKTTTFIHILLFAPCFLLVKPFVKILTPADQAQKIIQAGFDKTAIE